MSTQNNTNIDKQIVDQLRAVMYSTDDNVFEQVEYLGELLARRDEVAYDANYNRLTQAFAILRSIANISKLLK